MKLTKRDILFSENIAKHGEAFSEQLKMEIDDIFLNLDEDCNYFSVMLAISTTWTKHAKYDFTYINYASQFIDAQIAKDEDIIVNYSLRFGWESLDNVLKSYRLIMNRIKKLKYPDFKTCTADELILFQDKLLSLVIRLIENNEINGIGPWLFLGPFKILCEHQKRIWSDHNINNLVLPTGVDVEKGIKKMKKEGYTFAANFDEHWLEQGAQSLIQGYGTCRILHETVKEVGLASKTIALHINSGLHLYGANEID